MNEGMIDRLISAARQPIWAYFMPWDKGIVSNVSTFSCIVS